MSDRLRVEDPSEPRAVRFLHVLQGAGLDARRDEPVLVRTSSGTPFTGAAVGRRAVLFPVRVKAPFVRLDVTVPRRVRSLLVTGPRAVAATR